MYNSDYPDNKKPKEEDFGALKNTVRHKQKQRKVRKGRRKVNRLKSFLRFVIFVLLLLVTYEFFRLSGWYLPQDAFKNPQLGKVEVLNNKIIPDNVVKNEIKDIKVPNIPIFLMNINQIRKELYKIPVLKLVYVRRYAFPARIQIILTERIPLVILKTDLNSKPMAFYTSDGMIINAKNYMVLPNDSSVLKILTTVSAMKKDITVEAIEEIRRIVDEVENYSNEKVEYIDMRNPNDVYVKIKSANIRLGVTDSTVFERIKRIYTILPQITEVNSQIKYIDLSWDKVNYLKLKKGKEK